jgi:hypothetical protein
MSEMSQKYYLVIKMQEAYIKHCEMLMKTLESIEKETDSDDSSAIKKQMEKLVIENLNLFQDKTFIENIQGDKIMNQKTGDKVEVRLGNNAQISGNFVVAKTIENSFNKIDSSDLTNDIKELLKQLSTEVTKMTEHLSDDEAKDIVDDLETLVDKTTCEKPKRKWWSVSIDGLTKAAENLGKVGEPVLELLGKIAPLLIKISV